MSNAANKRRIAELAAHRAAHHVAPVQVADVISTTRTSVRVERTGRFVMKRVGWIKPDGTKGGCTMRVREANVVVSTREVSIVRTGAPVELTSGFGLRPNYRWNVSSTH